MLSRLLGADTVIALTFRNFISIWVDKAVVSKMRDLLCKPSVEGLVLEEVASGDSPRGKCHRHT